MHGGVDEALAVVGDEVVLCLTLLEIRGTGVALFQPALHCGLTKQSFMNGCYQPDGDTRFTPSGAADGCESA